jgi:hypothetical protein
VSSARVHLRALAEALPRGGAVPVPRDWLLELLGEGTPLPDSAGPQAANGTLDEIAQQFERRARDFDQFGALVNGGALCRTLLQDLERVRAAGESRVLSLAQAAAWSGYSEAHLARLVKEGKVTTLRPPGSRRRLTFQASDLPRKPATTHHSDAGVHDLASRLGLRGKEGRHGRS